MAEDTTDSSRRWTRGRRDFAAVVWPSFLVAAIASMLLFALIDPAVLGDRLPHPLWSSRTTAYSAGFLFLWLICIASAALTLYLVRTEAADGGPASR